MALLTVGMIGFIARRRARRRAARPARLRRRPRPDRGGHGHDRRGLPPAADRRMTALDLLIRGATVYPGDAPPFEGDVGVSGRRHQPCDTLSRGFGAAGGARGRRWARADALPGLHRPPHALRPAVVRRSAPDAEARAGLHDRGDQPRRPRAGPRRARAAGRAPGVPAAARGRRPGDMALVDGGGVPRRARRDAARALARALDRPRRRARARARRRAGRADRREPARRCGARFASASRPARACSRSGSSTCRAPTPPPTSSSRSPRRQPPSACRSCRTSGTRATGCSRPSPR